jgi:hypothetical protein
MDPENFGWRMSRPGIWRLFRQGLPSLLSFAEMEFA